MSIEIKMPALSPTMEEGTLAKWLVKPGDAVSSGDIMAEIETDKATMEFEAVDEGVIAHIAVAEGTEGVKVGTVIAVLAEEGEDPASIDIRPAETAPPSATGENVAATENAGAEKDAGDKADSNAAPSAPQTGAVSAAKHQEGRIIASPLARRIAAERGIDLASLSGSGPRGRIIRADVEQATSAGAQQAAHQPSTDLPDFGIPYETEKLSNVRKVIARRLTEAKQTIPHTYLSVDVRLDALLELRARANDHLADENIKLSVNDFLIKALAKALIRVPQCNVSFAGDALRKYSRADISVAVAAPSGLITPIIVDASEKPLSTISVEMKDLAAHARDGKLRPEEYQGGTASLSNLGMFGIKHFDAVINPPQAMILAVGAGEKRPVVVNDALEVATVMSVTGSFDHRAIDGADGALLLQAFKELVEKPLGLVI